MRLVLAEPWRELKMLGQARSDGECVLCVKTTRTSIITANMEPKEMYSEGGGNWERGLQALRHTDYLVLKFGKFGVPHMSWHTEIYLLIRNDKSNGNMHMWMWRGSLALLNISAGHF